MRTLLPRPRARRLARLTLVTAFGGAVGAAGLATDPAAVGRWGYRATIRARGGDFVSFPGAVLQSGASDCGPASLATLVITLGGRPPSLDSLIALSGTGVGGTRFGRLLEVARLLGVPGALRRLDASAMDRLSTPVIAWVDRSHFVTVVPESARTSLVLDPLAGPYRIERHRLRGYWSGEALVPAPKRLAALRSVNSSRRRIR